VTSISHKFIRRVLLTAMLSLLLASCLQKSDALDRIYETGKLRVAMDPSFPPFEFVDEAGNAAGLDVDMAQELAHRMNVEAHFVTTTYDGLYDALTVGRADVIISAIYPDQSRTQDFVFTPPYFNAGEVLVVATNSPIDTLADLSGQRISAVFGTAGHMEAMSWETLLDPSPTLTTHETIEEVLAALTNDEADAIVMDNLSAQSAKAQGTSLRIVDPPLTDESYVIAARSEDSALIEELTRHLQAMREDGNMDTLSAQWIH